MGDRIANSCESTESLTRSMIVKINSLNIQKNRRLDLLRSDGSARECDLLANVIAVFRLFKGYGCCIRFMIYISVFVSGCQTTDSPWEQGAKNKSLVEQSVVQKAASTNEVLLPGDSETASPVVLTANTTKLNGPLDKDRAFRFLQDICELGPRITGSEAMQRQQEILADHFRNLGGKVRLQKFRFPHPQHGTPQEAANMIVEWHPEKRERILICVHYDTRPQGDNSRVPKNQRGNLFLGANDGASGVALLMELAYLMREVESSYGVDFLLVDAEEFVFSDFPPQRYFWGSEYFARDYQKNPPSYQYKKGVVLDMIGDRHLQIYQDRNSVWWKDTRPITKEIWQTAERLGVKEFIGRTHPKMRTPIRDDHIMLRNVGKIPTCEIIDFDYPRFPVNRYWHTDEDTPERCSGDSMAKVGWVILEWLQLP